MLQHRANLLSSLLKFFHRDLQSLHDQYAQPAQQHNRNLNEKLYHIFETYLPMLQRNGNTFQNVPKLRMPKVSALMFTKHCMNHLTHLSTDRQPYLSGGHTDSSKLSANKRNTWRRHSLPQQVSTISKHL